MHRHQGEDEVGLVEFDALGIDTNEDLRHLFFVGCARELDDLEAEGLEVMDFVEAIFEQVFVRFAEPTLSHLAEALQELANSFLATIGPQCSDVGNEFRILLDGGVGDFKRLV